MTILSEFCILSVHTSNGWHLFGFRTPWAKEACAELLISSWRGDSGGGQQQTERRVRQEESGTDVEERRMIWRKDKCERGRNGVGRKKKNFRKVGQKQKGWSSLSGILNCCSFGKPSINTCNNQFILTQVLLCWAKKKMFFNLTTFFPFSYTVFLRSLSSISWFQSCIRCFAYCACKLVSLQNFSTAVTKMLNVESPSINLTTECLDSCH